MIEKELLERLYKSYGFEINKEYEDVSVFIYTKSRYFGVDIIPLVSDTITQGVANIIKDKFSKTGYAVNLKTISSNQEAEIELFKSFFSFDSSIERLKRKYREFEKKQTRNLLGNTYEYIEGPFELQDDFFELTGIFEIIEKTLISEQPELVIIEAAAGYGKTCTAYEVLNRISNTSTFQTPIFTELSRNRGVKKFRYILLDEIDLEYPSLNSQLVIKEIKNGRIPLIIDGFDELLEKVNIDSSSDNSFDEVETMLDTIGHLLEGKAKIILTTRKTAIFTGAEFEVWFQKWQNKFRLTRIALKEPRLKDWLGTDKYNLIKEKNTPIQYLANPVILSFLKGIELLDFVSLIENPEFLVEHYFQKMLEREKERQNLIMTVEKQLEVFRNVVKLLLELDSTSEDKEFFKQMILDQNKRLLDYTRSLYSGDEKHTVETLVDSLATHALLDRKGRDQNQIGFINDFVLGTLIGQILIDPHSEKIDKTYSSYMLEIAVTAFRVQGKKNKAILWSRLQDVLAKFPNEAIFSFDIYLKESLVRSHSELSIYDQTFYNIKFQQHKILSSVFLNCYFKNCIFESNELEGVSFINCKFDNCSVSDGEFIDDKNGVTVIKSTQERCSILIDHPVFLGAEKESLVSDLEKVILSKLWSISNTKGHHLVKLTKSFDHITSKQLYSSLKAIEEKEFIDIRGIHIYFVTNQIQKIKEILGLQNDL